jgi:glyoxylase-like metal-dependent hydrolase (beta-lactamase superfamily II)
MATTTSDTYEVYAVKYGTHARRASENFLLAPDVHDGPMPLDFYVWAIVGPGGTFVVDTGFDRAMAAKRKREIFRTPAEGLQLIGINPDTVKDVIITHMHYDHAGSLNEFPQARYHLQDREMAFCSGRHMCNATTRFPFEAEHVTTMVNRIFEGRVEFHDGDDELAPGVTLHHVGGHSLGLQVVRVRTRRGGGVGASDATHNNPQSGVSGRGQRGGDAGRVQDDPEAGDLRGARDPGARSTGAGALPGRQARPRRNRGAPGRGFVTFPTLTVDSHDRQQKLMSAS